MVYTEKVKKEMDAILKAYEGFLREQSYFDILYSEKGGYFRIIVETPDGEPAIRMETPDMLLETILDDIADDIVYKEAKHSLPEDEDLPEEIKVEVYHQIMEGVKKIEENREHYVHLAINYYQDRFERKPDGVE